VLETLQSLKDEYAAQSTPPRFIIAQVQDDFYGNVGTYNSIDNTTKHLSEGRDSVTYTLLITKIESCRYEYKR
jgi:hypothetical protein